MKTECGYCKKLLVDPFVDTDQNGRFYFFCNQEHRDKFAQAVNEADFNMAILTNPLFGLVFIAGWLRSKFKSKPARPAGLAKRSN